MKKMDGRCRSASEQELTRRIAVKMVHEEGFTRVGASRALGVSRQCVSRWCELYEQGGMQALKQGRRGRRPEEQAALKGWQCAKVIKLISDKTFNQLKLPFVLWTAAAVRDLVEQMCGVSMSLRTMRKYLARWGFTPQKPVRKAWQQCPRQVQHWLETSYRAIARRAKERGASIYWVDETGVSNQAGSQRGYAPRGQTPELRQSGKVLKHNMISALTNRGDVRFMCYSAKMTQLKFILFLSKLLKSTKKPVVVITDNLKVHHGKRVKQWVEEQKGRLELEFIPSYSLELNPDEYLNRDLKSNLNTRRSPATQEQLKQNIYAHMHSLQKQPERVKQYFNSKHISYAA